MKIAQRLLNEVYEFIQWERNLRQRGFVFEKKCGKIANKASYLYIPKELGGKTVRVWIMPIDEIDGYVKHNPNESVEMQKAKQIMRQAEATSTIAPLFLKRASRSKNNHNWVDEMMDKNKPVEEKKEEKIEEVKEEVKQKTPEEQVSNPIISKKENLDIGL